MLDELIMLADILDVGGFKVEASEIDSIIVRGTTVRPIIQSFLDDITKKIRENDSLDPETTETFIKELNDLANKDFKTLDEGDLEEMEKQENVLPQNIAGAVDSIKSVYNEMSATPNDPNILRDLHKYVGGLANNVAMLDVIIGGRRPGDQELATKILGKLGDKFNEAKAILTNYHGQFGTSREEIETAIPTIIERTRAIGSRAQVALREKRQLDSIEIQPGQEEMHKEDLQRVNSEIDQLRIYISSLKGQSTKILKSIHILGTIDPEYVINLKSSFNEKDWATLEGAPNMELKI